MGVSGGCTLNRDCFADAIDLLQGVLGNRKGMFKSNSHNSNVAFVLLVFLRLLRIILTEILLINRKGFTILVIL